MRRFAASLVICASLSVAPALAQVSLIPPVDAPIGRGFEAPPHAFGPGHRGIDLQAPPGTAVRAAASGTVSFAGRSPGGWAVTIDHGSGLETTYSLLAEVSVSETATVSVGQIVGLTDRAHDGSDGLHLSVKLEGAYVDPKAYLQPIDTGDALRLMPVTNRPVTMGGRSLDVRAITGRTPERCISGPRLVSTPSAPNDNIAVVVAGLGSDSGDAMLHEVAGDLGYRAAQTYAFSYRGDGGPRLHEEYRPQDTFDDIIVAASKLGDLLDEVARRHPGRSIDLLAHSQGGIVARVLLELVERELPHVEHLLTFATPHQGAPIAEALGRWDRATSGSLSWAARAIGGLPPADSPAMIQLAPGSDLMERLGDMAPAFGTRYLTIGIANDVVVPADRTEAHGLHRTVAPAGLHGHSAILGSASSLGTAATHLRGGPATCTGFWDGWGPVAGTVVGSLQWLVGRGSSLLSGHPWRLP